MRRFSVEDLRPRVSVGVLAVIVLLHGIRVEQEPPHLVDGVPFGNLVGHGGKQFLLGNGHVEVGQSVKDDGGDRITLGGVLAGLGGQLVQLGGQFVLQGGGVNGLAIQVGNHGLDGVLLHSV